MYFFTSNGCFFFCYLNKFQNTVELNTTISLKCDIIKVVGNVVVVTKQIFLNIFFYFVWPKANFFLILKEMFCHIYSNSFLFF